ncbi:acyl-CoA carboxylase subunit epsilon [Corynebacterium sp. 335C]
MTDQNTTEAGAPEAEAKKPFLTVLSGNPTPQETAALTVLFAGMANGAADSGPTGPRNLWGRYEDGFHRPSSYNPSSFMNVQFY